jgi:hypothetical protein
MNRFKLWDYGTVMAGALMAALIVRYEFVEAYKIPSDSMAPTLLVGDNLLANKLLEMISAPMLFQGVNCLRWEITETKAMTAVFLVLWT